MKVYSCWNPPNVEGEKSDLPSITDKLAAEDLSVTVERFLRNPFVPGSPDYDYEGEEEGAMRQLDEGVNVDVSQLDKVDCLAIVADAQRLAQSLQMLAKNQPKKVETKTDTPKVVHDVADETKNQN